MVHREARRSSYVGHVGWVAHPAVVASAPLPGSCGVSCLLLLLSLQGEPMRTSWPGKQAREVPNFFLSMAALCVLPALLLSRETLEEPCYSVLTCSAGFPPRNKDQLEWEESKTGL